MKKGRPLYIEGRLQTRSWEAEGKKNYRTEIVIDSFQFGASAGGEGGARSGAPREATEDPGQSGSGFGGSSMPSISASSGAMDSGSEIQYPDDEINPEDIPF
jgi:single-strand DNA-binding protein